MENKTMAIIDLEGLEKICTVINEDKVSSINFKNINELADDIMFRTCLLENTVNEDHITNLKLTQNIIIKVNYNYGELINKLKERGLKVQVIDVEHIERTFPKQFDFKIKAN